MKITITLFIILLYSTTYAQNTWTFDDAHSNLQFSLTHLMVADVEGSVEIRTADFSFSKPDMSDASIMITADMKTIDTDNSGRDEHLRGEDFFFVEKYPELLFKSTSWKKTGDNKYEVSGNLTFHGITKMVTMNVVATQAVRPYDDKTIIGFKANGMIKRSDFEIAATTPEAILSDEVLVKANLIFVKE